MTAWEADHEDTGTRTSGPVRQWLEAYSAEIAAGLGISDIGAVRHILADCLRWTGPDVPGRITGAARADEAARRLTALVSVSSVLTRTGYRQLAEPED